jgi:hypothetical protein
MHVDKDPSVILIKQFLYTGSMFRSLFTLVLISITTICCGQPDSAMTVSCPKPELKISYTSSMIYPGISAGAGLMIKERDIAGHKRKSRSDTITRRQFAAINLSWYHHPGFHDNLYLTCEWSLRKIRKSGYYSEFSTGPGFSRTFLGGTTYKIENNGDVFVQKHAGYNYAMLVIGAGIGFDFSSVKKTPVSVFAKINLISMFPYNSTIYFRPVLELGVRLNTIFFTKIRNKNDAIINFR